MKTTFDPWLRALATAGKGGTALADGEIGSATRGQRWKNELWLPGDWSASTLSGAVRSAPDAATVLATITCGSGTYDAVSGRTNWVTTLAAGTGANSTGVLPADGDADGVSAFPASYHLTTGGIEELLFGWAFILLGKV